MAPQVAARGEHERRVPIARCISVCLYDYWPPFDLPGRNGLLRLKSSLVLPEVLIWTLLSLSLSLKKGFAQIYVGLADVGIRV